MRELVERWKQGDRRAGNALFAKYYPELMAHTHRLFPETLRRRADTVDLVQDAIAAAIKSRETFEVRDTRSFRRWLLTIAEEKLWKRWRAERAQCRDINKSRLYEEGTRTSAALRSPSEELSSAEEAARLETAVGGLSPEHRRIVSARYFEGKSWREIASESGKSKEASQMLLLRALKRLRRVFVG